MMYDAGGRDNFMLIGTIGRAHGLGGQVRVRPFTDDPERYYGLEQAYIEESGKFRPIPIEEVSVNGEAVTLRLAGIADRAAAEQLNGKALYIRREDAVELSPGVHFISDIIGCAVEDAEGRPYGTLAEVLQHGAADVYTLRGGPSGEVMFPALKTVIVSVDVKAKKMVIDAARFKEVAVFED